jgi:DNA-binding SARP family transcriptional activator
LYLHVTRSLGGLAAERGDVDVATRYLMRAIAADPYDEPAHLELVRCLRTARRHGEAHRAYERYLGRMAELDVEPAPFPADPGSAVS